MLHWWMKLDSVQEIFTSFGPTSSVNTGRIIMWCDCHVNLGLKWELHGWKVNNACGTIAIDCTSNANCHLLPELILLHKLQCSHSIFLGLLLKLTHCICIYLFKILAKRPKSLYTNTLYKNIHIVSPIGIQVGIEIIKRVWFNYARWQIIPSINYTAGKNLLCGKQEEWCL